MMGFVKFDKNIGQHVSSDLKDYWQARLDVSKC